MQMCKIVYFKMCGLKCVLKYNMPTKLWAKFKWGRDVPRSYCVVCHHPEMKEICVYRRLLMYW